MDPSTLKQKKDANSQPAARGRIAPLGLGGQEALCSRHCGVPSPWQFSWLLQEHLFDQLKCCILPPTASPLPAAFSPFFTLPSCFGWRTLQHISVRARMASQNMCVFSRANISQAVFCWTVGQPIHRTLCPQTQPTPRPWRTKVQSKHPFAGSVAFPTYQLRQIFLGVTQRFCIRRCAHEFIADANTQHCSQTIFACLFSAKKWSGLESWKYIYFILKYLSMNQQKFWC